MNREIILENICPTYYACDSFCDTHECCSCCHPYLNKMLDEYENKIRVDAIDECIHHLDNAKSNCHEDYIDGIDFATGVLRSMAEQLKEQKK